MPSTKLSRWSRRLGRAAKLAVFTVRYGGRARYCPVCGRSFRKFEASGKIPRKDAQCPFCGALERHRLVWLYFQQRTDLLDGRPKQMLHVAAERCISNRLKPALGSGYLTADLVNPSAMVKMDITDIQYPDETFDVIYCSHVLEHIPDDRRALREFHRVLKREGWAILLVPISAEETFEDPTITDPAELLRIFGEDDHIRRYGPDYVDRLAEAGFSVKVTTPAEMFTAQERVRMGLTDDAGEIYFCTRA